MPANKLESSIRFTMFFPSKLKSRTDYQQTLSSEQPGESRKSLLLRKSGGLACFGYISWFHHPVWLLNDVANFFGVAGRVAASPWANGRAFGP